MKLDKFDKLLLITLILASFVYFAPKCASDPKPKTPAPVSTKKQPERPKAPKTPKRPKQQPKQKPKPKPVEPTSIPEPEYKPPPTKRKPKPKRYTPTPEPEYIPTPEPEPEYTTSPVKPTPVEPQAPVKSSSFEIAMGKIAPDFTVTDIFTKDQHQYNYYRDLKGNNVVLIHFWSIYAKSSLREASKLDDIFDRYKTEDIFFVGVNLDTNKRKLEKFLKDPMKAPSYPIIMDKTRTIANAYNVNILPTTVIIGKDGNIKFYHEGYKPGDERSIENIIKTLTESDHSYFSQSESSSGFSSVVGYSVPKVVLNNVKTNKASDLNELYADKVTVVVYMQTSDAASRKELEAIKRMLDHVSEMNVVVISVDAGSPARTLKYIDHYQFPFTFLHDPGFTTPELFGFSYTPATVVIGKDGKIIYLKSGYRRGDEKKLLEVVQDAMKK